MQELLSSKEKVVGLKQTVKAIKSDNAVRVYVAIDADEYIKASVREACSQKKLEITYINTMKELGEACGIDISASTAAIVSIQ